MSNDNDPCGTCSKHDDFIKELRDLTAKVKVANELQVATNEAAAARDHKVSLALYGEDGRGGLNGEVMKQGGQIKSLTTRMAWIYTGLGVVGTGTLGFLLKAILEGIKNA